MPKALTGTVLLSAFPEKVKTKYSMVKRHGKNRGTLVVPFLAKAYYRICCL